MANQYTKQKEKQRKKIFWNLINSGLAGLLVFLGSLTNGGISWKGIGTAAIAAAIVAVTRFYDFWKKEEKEYTAKIFNFLGG